MTSFVLQQHANSDTLRKMLHGFRGRIEDTRESEMPHLPNMFNALQKTLNKGQSTHHLMIYWPLTREAFNTKRCLYETSVNAIVPQAKPFHFVYITALLAKLHPKKDRFRKCDCANHAKDVSLDWREFVYPQFVELLFRRSLTPTSCPSPLAENTIQLINKTLQCRFEIDTQADFLKNVHLDVFRVPCAELKQSYDNSHLTVFGKEHIESDRHFSGRRVTEQEYKLKFVVSESRMRVHAILGGGRLLLKKSAEPYVVIACNFHFIPPVGDGANDYTIFVAQQAVGQHGQLVWHTEKYIKSDKFCARNTPCMIVSTCRLSLEFKERDQGCFILYTKGECDVTLGECYLEMWNKEPGRYGWPLKYEVNDDFLKSDYLGCEATFFDRLHLRYHKIFNEPACEYYDMCSPAHGYVTIRKERDVCPTKNGAYVLKSIYSAKENPLNQYGSNAPPSCDIHPHRSKTYNEVAQLRVYFKNGLPRFYATKEGGGLSASSEPLRIVTMTYHVDKQPYKMSGLCRKDESVPFCYFYINREKTYVLFIPLY